MTTRPARIIHVAPGGRHGQGGMSRLAAYLLEALPARIPGASADIIDSYGPGPFWRMPGHFALAVLRVLLVRLRGASLVHLHMACFGSTTRKTALAALATAVGLKTVVHLHGAELERYFAGLGPIRRRWLTGVLRRTDRVVVIGDHWRDFAIRVMGLRPSQVERIHNGVPARPLARAPRGPVPRVLMLGELSDRKGTPELLAALGTASCRSRQWTATLAGNGPTEIRRREVESLGLAGRVAIPGWQPRAEVLRLLNEADILVLASHEEGLPLAILEAMAGGAAVITTPVGAVRDAVTDGETGRLVPPGDVPALAAAIAALLDDEAERSRLAANARRRFEAMFTIERTADATAALYRSLGIG